MESDKLDNSVMEIIWDQYSSRYINKEIDDALDQVLTAAIPKEDFDKHIDGIMEVTFQLSNFWFRKGFQAAFRLMMELED